MNGNIFTQISQRSGVVKRVKRDEEPVAELLLQEGQYVIGLEWSEYPDRFSRAHERRKTSDWTWTATIVTPLPNPS